MRIGFVIYGSIDAVSGGYLYDRKLVECLRAEGETVEIISLPWRNYASHLTDNFHFRLPQNLDILIEDELNHPSLCGPKEEKPLPRRGIVTRRSVKRVDPQIATSFDTFHQFFIHGLSTCRIKICDLDHK